MECRGLQDKRSVLMPGPLFLAIGDGPRRSSRMSSHSGPCKIGEMIERRLMEKN
jgi:hypothetical protein